MFKKDVINLHDRVHLLGCATPQEFNFYQHMPFIETIDTSNPIMAAIEGLKYTKDGLLTKPKIKIDETMNMTYTDLCKHMMLIYHNIDMFKQINNIKKWETQKSRTLYNLSVEDDESYIAKGVVVHNCRCVALPIITVS